SVITRQVCNALSFKVGTNNRHTDFGTTTCYNMTWQNTVDYFIPECKRQAARPSDASWVCY
ncbi:uncharacterized protein B0P05DRAFT_466996, partial [Gilbertella persicaria]|uniref:uncharacterized protein n=1 Tax=Gilbertella persicaria TaxID=101096 RepID=UPI0022210DA1